MVYISAKQHSTAIFKRDGDKDALGILLHLPIKKELKMK